MRQIIDSTQIDRWFSSTRRDAQELLPHLVRKLVAATVDLQALSLLRIPAADDIGRPGYDGRVVTTDGNPWVPAGLSVWEMGTGDNPKRKADEDYAARCRNSRGIDPQTATFVFVTPHRWDSKDDWADEKRGDGRWKDIRVLDNSDLAGWLELAPGVARWLAHQMGVPLEGFRDLELFVAESQAEYGVPLDPDLVIGGREDALKRLHDWIESDEREVRIEGESPEEAALFIAAAILKLPENRLQKLVPRVLFADRPEAIDYLTGTGAVSFVVPLNPETYRRAKALGSPALRFLVPRGKSGGTAGDARWAVRLGTIRREPCEKALAAMEIPAQRARRIAQECKGSLTAVLWMLSGGQDLDIPWTTGAAALDLVPLMLAGQWVPSNQGDKAALAEMSGRLYVEVERVAADWMSPAGPLVRRGPVLDWLGWDFAWGRLSPFVDQRAVDRFRAVVKKVLGEPDPKFELEADQRWAAQIHGKEHPYSVALRSGLAGSIVQMALHDEALAGGAGQTLADAMVRELLGGEGTSRKSAWLSLAPWLPDLAEAAPDVFLQVAGALAEDNDAVCALFEEGGMLGSSPHTYPLWALERLAWSEHYFSRVAQVLGKLAAADPGGHLSNRPINSLKEIFLPWHPQTAADLRHRLDAIDLVHRRYPDVVWELAVALLPRGHRVAMPTARPKWRSWKPSGEMKVTVVDYWRFVEGLVDRMIRWASTSGERWKPLIKGYGRLRKARPGLADRVLEAIQELEPATTKKTDRLIICDALREFLAWHSDAESGMSDDDLRPLEHLCRKFQPSDLLSRHKWLFVYSPRLPGRRELDYEEETQRIQDERAKAVQEIYEALGIDGVLKFAEKVEAPGAVGAGLGGLDLDEREQAELLARTLGCEATHEGQPALLQVGIAYISYGFHEHGQDWVNRIIALRGVEWDASKYANLALGLPPEGPTWDRLEHWGEEAVKSYWLRAPVHYLREPGRDGARAVQSLLGAGRPLSAIYLIDTCLHKQAKHEQDEQPLVISKDLILQALKEAPQHSLADEPHPPAANMLGYHVGCILDALEQEGVEQSVLGGLEWTWMPALEHTKRGLKALQYVLSENPRLFVEALTLIFRGENEEPRDASEEGRAKARQAFDLLRVWHRVPGTIEQQTPEERSDGDIAFGEGLVDKEKLLDWVKEARRLAESCGRLSVCDSHIGGVLAHAPAEGDCRWPCEPVCDLIEEVASEDIEHGLEIGVYNKRGVHWRGKGGDQERCLAAKFRGYAERLRSHWPRTAAVLDRIAFCYDREARREDERAAFEEFE